MATSKTLCKYYITNSCTKGHECQFSHDFNDKPDMTCRYYQMGSCSYGDKCRYSHIKFTKSKGESANINGRSKEPDTRSRMPPPVSLSAAAGLTLEPEMVTLKKDPTRKPTEWIKATEFVPGRIFHGVEEVHLLTKDLQEDNYEEYFFSYSDVATSGLPSVIDEISTEEASMLMCPFYEMTGQCPWDENCEYIHGELCDMCFKHSLNPNDPQQQKEHRQSCVKMHEEEMEKAFALQKSEGQTCGVCMDVVLNKPIKSDRRFGILSDCDHCFCLGCIRKWRNSTHSSKKTIRACPLCRVISYIVIPSELWITDPQEKQKLMESYKKNLSKKPCKYFNEGNGTCPFGPSCFYRHALPDNTLVESVPRVAINKKGKSKIIGETLLWDFMQDREEREWEPPAVDHYWTESEDEEEED